MTKPGIPAVPSAVAALRLAALLFALGASSTAWSQAAPPRAIYTCTDASGRKLTSDRLIAECMGREQRVLNPDGSMQRVVPPVPTVEERNQAEAREREAAAARDARKEAVRRDRSLIARFPNEASHKKAREAALDNVRRSLSVSETRLEVLAKERKPLLAEAEFYAGKPVPAKLKGQLDANEVTADAQRTLIQNQQLEVVRIDKGFDAELERLKKLWAGAAPGFSGSLAPGAAAAPAKP